MNLKINEKRIVGADLARVIACYCVLSVHFFLYTGFYNENPGGLMLPFLFIRTFSMICVPLFMILTGFLMHEKTLSKGYYRKGLKTPLIYILAGLVCVGFNEVFTTAQGFSNIVMSFLNFTAAPYAWYIEMYLGLYLLIPFLNLIYHNLPGKKEKLILIGTLFLLTSLPSVTNIFNFSGTMDWTRPLTTGDNQVLLPQWWKGIYPLFYYFVGAYISEYQLKIRPLLGRLLVFLSVLLHALFCVYRSNNGAFVWGTWSDWGSPMVAFPAIVLFTICVGKSNERFPKFIRWLLAKMSDLCLGAYLVSYTFDTFAYALFTRTCTDVFDRMPWYFVLVPLGFFISLCLSFIIEKVYKLLKKAENCVEKKIVGSRNEQCAMCNEE